MKKILIISLFIFWAMVAAILTAGLVFYQNNNSINSSQNPGNQNPGDINLPKGQSLFLVAQEIAKHSSTNNCWMIISNKVYNLTSYLAVHPGGGGAIVPYCGKDGTVAFATKDIGQPHSSAAQNFLADYFIGNLGQTISEAVSLPRLSNQPAPSLPVSSQIITPSPTPRVTPLPSTVALTLAEVAKHSAAANCWMIISGKVYNFTSYISQHPGGSQMAPYCGQDGSAAFFSGPPHAHSSFAANLLTNYLLGDLNTSVTVTPTPAGATPAPTPASGRREEEDD